MTINPKLPTGVENVGKDHQPRLFQTCFNFDLLRIGVLDGHSLARRGPASGDVLAQGSQVVDLYPGHLVRVIDRASGHIPKAVTRVEDWPDSFPPLDTSLA